MCLFVGVFVCLLGCWYVGVVVFFFVFFVWLFVSFLSFDCWGFVCLLIHLSLTIFHRSDYLYVGVGTVVGQNQLASYTSSVVPSPLTIIGGSAWLHFQSDADREYSGFRITWDAAGKWSKQRSNEAMKIWCYWGPRWNLVRLVIVAGPDGNTWGWAFRNVTKFRPAA